MAVVGERGVARFMVLDEIEQSVASRQVRKWLGTGIRKEPALASEARFREAFLAWFPFIRVRFDIVGWILGKKRKRVKRGNQWKTVEVPVEREVEEHVDRTFPAAEMAEFGVHQVDLRGDRLLPFDQELLRKKGMVFTPNRAASQVTAQVCATEMELLEKRSSPDRVSFSWLASIRRRTTIVYYPLWVFRYSFRGRTYQALIDAEDTTLAYGKAPGNHLYRAVALVGACAGACFVGTTVLQHFSGLLSSEHGVAALGVIGLVLAGLIGWGYTQFRFGGVVEEGSGRLGTTSATSIAELFKDSVDKLT